MPRQVCPESAKVQLNNGILARRTADWDAALAHFERAQEIEPTYCEPDYWAGLSLLNANRSASSLVHHAETYT
jgi:Flp pilus assembly protein TadD